MAPRKGSKNQYYVVFKGKGINMPTIFSSWYVQRITTTLAINQCLICRERPKASKRISGFPGNKHKAFQTYEEALAAAQFRAVNGEYQIDKAIKHHESPPTSSSESYYAVANGHTIGVYV